MAAQSRPTLLLTRPEPAATRFAAQLRERFGDGLEILSSPLMAPVFLAPTLPGGWQGTIFTSETGVEGLRRLTGRRGPAVCVGPRTAEAAQAAGWQAEVIGGDANGLVAALTRQPRPGLWLHARGREAAGDLAARLRTAGMSVTEAVVYAQEPRPLTEAARARLMEGAPVIVPLFSPRSAGLFVAQTGGTVAPLLVAAISKAAADAVGPLGALRVECAPTPDGPGMLTALARLMGAGAGA